MWKAIDFCSYRRSRHSTECRYTHNNSRPFHNKRMTEAPILIERERLENGEFLTKISLDWRWTYFFVQHVWRTYQNHCIYESLASFEWSVRGCIGINFRVRTAVLWSPQYRKIPKLGRFYLFYPFWSFLSFIIFIMFDLFWSFLIFSDLLWSSLIVFNLFYRF